MFGISCRSLRPRLLFLNLYLFFNLAFSIYGLGLGIMDDILDISLALTYRKEDDPEINSMKHPVVANQSCSVTIIGSRFPCRHKCTDKILSVLRMQVIDRKPEAVHDSRLIHTVSVSIVRYVFDGSSEKLSRKGHCLHYNDRLLLLKSPYDIFQFGIHVRHTPVMLKNSTTILPIVAECILSLHVKYSAARPYIFASRRNNITDR